MRFLAALLALFLLASLGLSGATAGDVPGPVLRRLLERRADPERPLLGLLVQGPLGDVLDADREDRPGYEEEEDDEEDDALGERVAWLLSRGRGQTVAAGRLRRIAVDAEIRVHGRPVQRVRLVAAPGCRALHEHTRVLRAVTDYSAEIACDNSGGLRPSAVGDPVLTSLLDGLALDVRPFLVGGVRGRVALEVLLQAGRFDRPVARLDTRALFLGDLDLPRYRGVLFSASGSTAVGQPLELSVANDEGGRYRVRLTPHVIEVPLSGDPARVQRLDTGFLTAPRADVGFARHPDPYFNPPIYVLPRVEWIRPTLDRASVWELVDGALPGVEMRLPPDGDVWIAADENAVADVGRAFDTWAVDAARTVHVGINAYVGDQCVASARVPVLTGRTAFFRLGTDRAVLPDADVEVG